ncbi:MAG: hypothetical protein KDC75_10890 [Phaeodactylibacter sp.]|nr:hypothetical protein [Phaeodactylibacter sp.]
MDNVEATYVCDVDARRQEAAIGKVEKAIGKKPKGEKDMRRIHEQPDVDVVFHATPGNGFSEIPDNSQCGQHFNYSRIFDTGEIVNPSGLETINHL